VRGKEGWKKQFGVGKKKKREKYENDVGTKINEGHKRV
jgi:hypothetical protein